MCLGSSRARCVVLPPLLPLVRALCFPLPHTFPHTHLTLTNERCLLTCAQARVSWC